MWFLQVHVCKSDFSVNEGKIGHRLSASGRLPVAKDRVCPLSNLYFDSAVPSKGLSAHPLSSMLIMLA